MSASLRKFRARLYQFADAGSGGVVDMTYSRIPSTDPDESWWCARVTPTGREVTTGMKPEHRVDAVFSFAAHAPVTVDGAVVLWDGAQSEEAYMIRAILPRDYGRDEVQVYGERLTDLILTP